MSSLSCTCFLIIFFWGLKTPSTKGSMENLPLGLLLTGGVFVILRVAADLVIAMPLPAPFLSVPVPPAKPWGRPAPAYSYPCERIVKLMVEYLSVNAGVSVSTRDDDCSAGPETRPAN